MEYDDLNRLWRRPPRTPAGSTSSPRRRASTQNGNPEEVVDPKGQTITSTFDELNRLKTKSYAFAPGDPLRPWRHTASFEYTYDANGNLLQADEHVASGTDPPATTLVTTRTYDGLDRLTSETAAPARRRHPDGRATPTTATASARRSPIPRRRHATTPTTARTGSRRPSPTSARRTRRRPRYTYWPDDLLHTVSVPERRRGDPRLRQGRPTAVARQRQGRDRRLVLPVRRHPPVTGQPSPTTRTATASPRSRRTAAAPRRRATPTTTSTASRPSPTRSTRPTRRAAW